MSRMMDKALKELSKLPENEQEAIGAWLLEELASERRWQESFAASPDVLANLADQALNEHRRGRAQSLDPDRL